MASDYVSSKVLFELCMILNNQSSLRNGITHGSNPNIDAFNSLLTQAELTSFNENISVADVNYSNCVGKFQVIIEGDMYHLTFVKKFTSSPRENISYRYCYSQGDYSYFVLYSNQHGALEVNEKDKTFRYIEVLDTNFVSRAFGAS